MYMHALLKLGYSVNTPTYQRNIRGIVTVPRGIAMVSYTLVRYIAKVPYTRGGVAIVLMNMHILALRSFIKTG